MFEPKLMSVVANAMAVGLLLVIGNCSSSPGLVPGFIEMDFPQRDVPIGAAWIQGHGPSGDPLDSSMLLEQQSFDNFESAQESKARIEGKLGSYIGLETYGNLAKKISLDSVTFVRVRDVTKMDRRRARYFIFSGVRIDGFRSEVKSDLSSMVEIDIKTKLPNASIVATRIGGSDRNLIVASGARLFIAFSVTTIKHGHTDLIGSATMWATRKSNRLDASDPMTIGEYVVSIAESSTSRSALQRPRCEPEAADMWIVIRRWGDPKLHREFPLCMGSSQGDTLPIDEISDHDINGDSTLQEDKLLIRKIGNESKGRSDITIELTADVYRILEFRDAHAPGYARRSIWSLPSGLIGGAER